MLTNAFVDILSSSDGVKSKVIVSASYTDIISAGVLQPTTQNIKYTIEASIQTESDILAVITSKDENVPTVQAALPSSDDRLEISKTIGIKEQELTDIDNMESITTGIIIPSISYILIFDNIYYNK